MSLCLCQANLSKFLHFSEFVCPMMLIFQADFTIIFSNILHALEDNNKNKAFWNFFPWKDTKDCSCHSLLPIGEKWLTVHYMNYLPRMGSAITIFSEQSNRSSKRITNSPSNAAHLWGKNCFFFMAEVLFQGQAFHPVIESSKSSLQIKTAKSLKKHRIVVLNLIAVLACSRTSMSTSSFTSKGI